MGQPQYCRDFQQQKKNCMDKYRISYEAKEGKNKQTTRLHKENHIEFLQHSNNLIIVLGNKNLWMPGIYTWGDKLQTERYFKYKVNHTTNWR